MILESDRSASMSALPSGYWPDGDDVPDYAVCLFDTQGRIMGWSRGAQPGDGASEAEMAGWPGPMSDWHDQAMGSPGVTVGGASIVGDQVVERGWCLRKDGSRFPASVRITALRDADGRVCGFGNVIRELPVDDASMTDVEVTATHMCSTLDAVVRLDEWQANAQHKSRVSAMETLASTLAHELNQPITAVANYVETAVAMLANRDAATILAVREALSDAAREALRAGRVIHELRKLLLCGKSEKAIESLPGLIEDACTRGLLGAREREIRCRIVHDDFDATVFVDRDQIHEVLINLLQNAVEALAPAGGDITITTARDGRFVRVTVCDTGPGLPDAVIGGLFWTFVTTKRSGMGLGLSLCRTIIEAHGGRIWADPRSSSGARFHFTLPHVEADWPVEHE